MKFLRRSLFALASFAMLASCGTDELLVDDPNSGGSSSTGDGVYMGLTIKMPSATGSRSTTTDNGQSDDGNEEGQDYENTVSDVIIVIADPTTNGYVTSGTVASNKLTAVPNENAYKSVAKVELSELSDYYNTSIQPTINTSCTVNIWVICNPTTQQREAINAADFGDSDWINTVTDVSEDASEIASKTGSGRFVMTNASVATRQLPNSVADWNYYKTEATAFDLSGINQAGQDVEVDNSAENKSNPRGAIKVERMASRFDFKDGSPDNTDANTYDVIKDTDGNVLIQIALQKMSLVNLSKSMYNFRRVSTNGQDAGAVIGDAETSSNYVVGPNAAAFVAATNNNFGYNETSEQYSFDFSNYFWQSFFTQTGRMDYSKWQNFAKISDVLGGASDNYGAKEYVIWHYAAENVIPALPSRQQNGISTGVVFKGKMIGTDALKESNSALYAALNGEAIQGNQNVDPILYSFNGSLYFTWNEMFKAAIKASVEMKNDVPVVDSEGKITVNRSNSLYLAVFGNGGLPEFTWGESENKYSDPDGLEVDPNSPNNKWEIWNAAVIANSSTISSALANMRQAMTGAGITLYQSSTDTDFGKGYYCYYFYWNRHNDNNDLGTTNPMEFAVVRNNVYKLAVTGISQLGHPRTPENDPDSPTPDTPDESTDIYITVTCEVLPWVVRVNNIEF